MTSLADLLARVHEAPDDLVVRSIYADALQAVGDPRGEFIALQLAHADPTSADALLDTHWREWLGPLAACTTRRGITFRHGFVVHLDIARPPEMTRLEWHRIHRAAEWSTVEALRIQPEALASAAVEHLAGVIDHASLPALHTLDAPAAVLRIVEGRRPALRSIAVTAHDEPIFLDATFAHGTYVIARRLGWNIRNPADTGLWQLALDAKLAGLAIAMQYLHANIVPHIIEALVDRHRRPAELWYRFPDCHVALRRDELELRVQRADPTLGADAVELLRDYESVLDQFAHVTVVEVDQATEHTALSASGEAALRWLAERPPPIPDPEDDD